MARDWRIFAHPDYLMNFRTTVVNPDDRFKVTTGIRTYLSGIDNPSRELDIVPGEIDQYEFEIMKYTIIVQWKPESAYDIKLLTIYTT